MLQYLETKPFYLPEKIAPLVASPQIHLFATGNGTGYIEVISYCTCANGTRYKTHLEYCKNAELLLFK